MITDEQVARINELARKSKSPEGLTEDEKTEQTALRRLYIESVRTNMKAMLDNIELVD